jgi:hypothetical protein
MANLETVPVIDMIQHQKRTYDLLADVTQAAE